MKLKRLDTPVRQRILKMSDSHIKTYVERHGYEISVSDIISGLSYLLMQQPYNPVLWNLYSVCCYLRNYKPKTFGRQEIRIKDYYVEKHWLSGCFSDIRDIIAIDNVETKNPSTAIVTLYAPDIQDLTLADSLIDKKTMYIIPVEWVSYIAVRDYCFVLLPFKFCCREVLLRTSTQMVRCQSLLLEPQYLVDETYFHVGCGPCRESTADVMVEIFAGLSIHVGIRNLMMMLKQNIFLNSAEMLYAAGRYEPVLAYYKQPIVEGKPTKVTFKGSEIKSYLAHILVCKYLFDFLALLDQSVEHHPYPQHTEVANDRLNNEGIPIYEYVLDADFDVLRDKCYYGLTDEPIVDICSIVQTFMSTYIMIARVNGPIC
jgi:hypothetical protein